MTSLAYETSPAGRGLSIHLASSLLGVPAPTLRSWERRYGVPVTSRSAGGHRRYFTDELNQLRLMRDEIGRGKRAAEAALSVRMLLDQDNPAVLWIDRLLAASEMEDPEVIRAEMDGAVARLGLAQMLDGVLMPAMRQVGAWWETGRCDIAREHLTTETARGWLARYTALLPLVTYDPPILLACAPQDLHTIGLEALAALLAERHRGCRIMGAHTSELSLVSAAGSSSAAAVVVVSHMSSRRRSAVEALRAVERLGCPVFYAGNSFAFPSSRTGVPGTYLGQNFAAASVMILDSVAVGAPSPSLPQNAA